MTMPMTENDYLALSRAMHQAREQGRAAQIDAMLQSEPWQAVAMFAAGCCQCVSLKLKPWESPPAEVIDIDHPGDSERVAAKLLKKMLDCGVSRWHPDPQAALAQFRRR
jgi:hypothetical protein